METLPLIFLRMFGVSDVVLRQDNEGLHLQTKNEPKMTIEKDRPTK